MSRLNHLEIYKYLAKTNCRECGMQNCLALAAAVMRGEKRLADCPYVDRVVAETLGDNTGPDRSEKEDWEKQLEELQEEIRRKDLASLAGRLGAVYDRERLAVKCLGKDFFIDRNGNMTSECHNNRWVLVPLLHYIAHSAGLEPGRSWVPFRELNGGAVRAGLFAKRCEEPMRKLVDSHTDLFELLVDIFDGEPAGGSFDSDISVVLYPLPKVPLLISYWKKEADLDSSLSLFFDATVNENLNIGSTYILSAGLLTMFEKIALTHGRGA